MNNKTMAMRGLQLFAGGALLMLANLAHAQFVWIDDKGVKQFSDQAPPGSVPQKNILKSPRHSSDFDTTEAVAHKTATPDAPAPKSLADREADYRKRQETKTANDAKAAAAESKAAQKKASCDAGRAQSAQLATGRRMRANTPDRAPLDDNARAQQQAKANEALADCN